MIHLPPPRMAYIKSFWLSVSALAGLGLSWALWMWEPTWTILGITFTLISCFFGIWEINPRIMWVAYKVWMKIVDKVCIIVNCVILWIAFAVLFSIVGTIGTSLILKKPPSKNTLWVPRATLDPQLYESPSPLPGLVALKNNWILKFLGWAIPAGHYWTLALLPFLILTSLYTTVPNDNQQTTNYTLY